MCVQVLKALKVKYGNLYRQDNVVLSGTHTHSGPAGYFQYTLFMITSSGYIKESIKPLVDGIVKVCVCVVKQASDKTLSLLQNYYTTDSCQWCSIVII